MYTRFRDLVWRGLRHGQRTRTGRGRARGRAAGSSGDGASSPGRRSEPSGKATGGICGRQQQRAVSFTPRALLEQPIATASWMLTSPQRGRQGRQGCDSNHTSSRGRRQEVCHTQLLTETRSRQGAPRPVRCSEVPGEEHRHWFVPCVNQNGAMLHQDKAELNFTENLKI